MIKLIASDLDGTLLQNGSQILHTELFDIIEQLHKNGILFVAASGRQYPNLKRLFAPVSDKIAFICENGALVMYQGEVLKKISIDRCIGLDLINDIWNYEDCEILLSGQYTSYLQPKSQEYVDLLTNTVKNNVMVLNNITTVTEEFLKISIYEKKGVVDNCSKYFIPKWQDKVMVAYSGYEWLDFTAKGVNKGNALRTIQNRFQISKEECMAFGDNLNDIELMQAVGYPYAMENAKQQLKAICNYVCQNVETTLLNFLHSLPK